MERIAGRLIAVDPVSEILAKKLFYRAATFKVRDVYDLSAAIDLEPQEAAIAVRATLSKREILVRRLDRLRDVVSQDVTSEIIAYGDVLQHGHAMVEKVRSFVMAQRDEPLGEPGAPAMSFSPIRRKNRELDP